MIVFFDSALPSAAPPKRHRIRKIVVAALCLAGLGTSGCQSAVWPDEPGEGRPSRPPCQSNADCLPETKCMTTNFCTAGADRKGKKMKKTTSFCDTDLDGNGIADLIDAKWTKCCTLTQEGVCFEIRTP